MPARLAQQRTAFNAPVLAEWSQQRRCSSVVAAASLHVTPNVQPDCGICIDGLRRTGAVC